MNDGSEMQSVVIFLLEYFLSSSLLDFSICSPPSFSVCSPSSMYNCRAKVHISSELNTIKKYPKPTDLSCTQGVPST